MPTANGPALLDQCTRRVPSDVTGYWTPDRATIERIEQALPGLLGGERLPSGRSPLAASEYYRQYIGIQRGGQKLVYVNAFHRRYVHRHLLYDDTLHGRTVFRDSAAWRTAPVSACDGGSDYFGVEYDVTADEFGPIYFNAKA